jgi:2-dehydropantoate 2-reductase
MRIAVFGTGGAGGYFGALLARAGEDVTFIARGEHLQAMRAKGLVVETPAGDIRIQPAQATGKPAELGPVDLVLLGVKAWQVSDAAQAMAPMIGPDTTVIPLQNGVEAYSQLASVLGPKPVLAGLCGTFSWVAGPGRIRNIGGANFIRFGEIDNRRGERVEKLLQMFTHAGVKAEVPADIHQALWTKFLAVTSFGGIGALSRAPIGVLRTIPQTRRLLERCMEEVFDLATAHGAGLADLAVANTLAFLDGWPPAGPPPCSAISPMASRRNSTIGTAPWFGWRRARVLRCQPMS